MSTPSGQHMSGVCPCCGAAAPWLLDATDVNRQVDGKIFSYHKCADCGLVFLRDAPADIEKYYAGGYQSIPTTLDELKTLAAREKYRIEAVTHIKRNGTLLEIGPWNLHLLC